MNSAIKGGGLKELEFRGTSPCVKINVHYVRRIILLKYFSDIQ